MSYIEKWSKFCSQSTIRVTQFRRATSSIDEVHTETDGNSKMWYIFHDIEVQCHNSCSISFSSSSLHNGLGHEYYL